MKLVKCSNVLNLFYDDTLKAGDLITTYNKGYYEFIKFEERGDCPPLAYFRLVFKEDGSPATSSRLIRKCDSSYCRKAKQAIFETIQKKQQEISRLEIIFNTL